MDWLERPEVKSTYDKCKYVVKLWEHNFKKTKGRLPSKLDIHDADKSVRDAYRKYYQLKTKALEQSFKDVDGFNSDEENTETAPADAFMDVDKETAQVDAPLQAVEGVWGEHLNKKPEKPQDVKKTDPNTSFNKKIFCGSKLSKRYSRKSTSFSQRKTESNLDCSVLSQPVKSDSDIGKNDNGLSFEGIFSKCNIVSGAADRVVTQPLNIIQSVLDNNYKTLKSVDAGWLERVAQSTGVEIEQFTKRVDDPDQEISAMCLDYNSDDFIASSDDEIGCNTGPQAKKSKLETNLNDNINNKAIGINFSNYNPYHSHDPIHQPVQNNSCAIQDTSVQSTSAIAHETSTFAQCSTSVQNTSAFPRYSCGVQDVNTFVCNTKTALDDNSTVIHNTGVVQEYSVQYDNSAVLNSNAHLEVSNTVDNVADCNTFEFENDYQETQIMPKKADTKTAVTKRKKRTSKKPMTPAPVAQVRMSKRSTKANTVMTESHSEDEDPFHSDNDSRDPEFIVDKSKKLNQLVGNDADPVARTKTSKQRRRSANKASESEDTNTFTGAPYELEYSIKPRVSAPRFKNLKKLIKIETATDKDGTANAPPVKNKRQQELDKLEKKVQSGRLNENFVTINLKKKVYCRGKKTLTFSKFKKQQWKSKKKALAGPDMDMGGCDGGMLTCFNCGQVGHFARNCTKTKGDGLLPLEADEEVCPFPTLEEASKLAKESSLAIRKPNVHPNAEDTEKESVDGDESEAVGSGDDDLFDDEVDTEQLLAETLKLEEHVAKLDLQQYMDQVAVVQPYYQTNDDGSIKETPKEVFDALEKFGHSSFRSGQEMAIMRILSGKSTLVTLSTGSGKSLCYQLPAYLYSQREPCISLIVSPLVSLMEDQVTGIPYFLKAACLHTNQTKPQRERIMEAIASGQLNVLLVSPEAVVAGERSSGFGSLIRRLPPIAFACIDEAHCVSQWSHNFRPSYLMICRVLREKMGVRTVLGLTATATRATSDSIITHLEIPDGRDGIISDVPLPDNLHLTVSKDYQRDQALLGLLTSDRFKDCKSVIVYCTRREECNRITKFLRTSFQYEDVASKKRKRVSCQAEPYHAGLAASRRRTIQKAFMCGELKIVVATVAFGMGINKSDIRSVIHYNMPKNFESYVQEIGRAGRDGLPAHCHLFLDAKGKDENELRRHIYANSIDRHVIRKLLQKIFLPCSCKEYCPKHEVAFSIEETVRELDIPEENISTLLCYLELHQKKYVELLSPAYTRCKIISYGGPVQMRKAAKECPPLAMALALQKNQESNSNVLEFAVVDIAAAIGWDSGICKHKLKNLEWTAENGLPKRSLLNVTFSNLGFRLLAPGNLNDDQLDKALDSLYDHVVVQEKTALLQLRAVHETLVEVATPTYRSCLSQNESESNCKLKARVRDYFESPNPLENIVLTENTIVDEDHVINDIRGLISTYRDNNFTGRAVARIFHGIASPNYPAVIWGRCKYWRSHIHVDFHTICKLALKEILYFR